MRSRSVMTSRGDVLAADRGPARLAQGHMQHGAILGAIDVLAREHALDAIAQLHEIGQRIQLVQRFLVDALPREIHRQAQRRARKARVAARVLCEQVPGVHGAQARFVGGDFAPDRRQRSGSAGHGSPVEPRDAVDDVLQLFGDQFRIDGQRHRLQGGSSPHAGKPLPHGPGRRSIAADAAAPGSRSPSPLSFRQMLAQRVAIARADHVLVVDMPAAGHRGRACAPGRPAAPWRRRCHRRPHCAGARRSRHPGAAASHSARPPAVHRCGNCRRSASGSTWACRRGPAARSCARPARHPGSRTCRHRQRRPGSWSGRMTGSRCRRNCRPGAPAHPRRRWPGPHPR